VVEAAQARAWNAFEVPGSSAAIDRELLVFCDRPIICSGVVGLLPDEWRGSAARHSELPSFVGALSQSTGLALIDANALGAQTCAELTAAAGVPFLVLLDRADARMAPEMLRAANAVLLTEDLDRETMQLAVGAALRRLRLFPQVLDFVAAAPSTGPQPPRDRMDVALALVANGCRDAEIASKLNLSESAARKLVQRAVARLGARTRCEAIVTAMDQGHVQ
jgi:DNA-binding NarL/FixJ family response regulator